VSCASSNSCTSLFRTVFLFHSITPSSLRLLLSVCACTDLRRHRQRESVRVGQRDQDFMSVRQIVGTVGHEHELHVGACSPRSAAAAVYGSLSHAAGASLPGQQDGFQTQLKALLSSWLAEGGNTHTISVYILSLREGITAHPHQPGARPDPPHPDPAHRCSHHPTKAKVRSPLQNRISPTPGH